MTAIALAGLLGGAGDMQSYPVVSIDAGGATLALALAIPLIAALPFAPSRRGLPATRRVARA